MSAVSKRERRVHRVPRPDLMMSTFLEAALALRAVHISTAPCKTARQISAEQFRPQPQSQKEADGTLKRDTSKY
jgi:hypothetical protein